MQTLPKDPTIETLDEVEVSYFDLNTDLVEDEDLSTTGVWGEELDIDISDIDEGPWIRAYTSHLVAVSSSGACARCQDCRHPPPSTIDQACYE